VPPFYGNHDPRSIEPIDDGWPWRDVTHHRETVALSDAAIHTFVAELLADQGVNLSLLPDAVEARIYEQATRSVLAALSHVTQTFRCELIGHELTLHMRPMIG